MAEALEKIFGNSAKVLVKDGEFNDVEGEYYHYDYSQHITNNGCHNIINNRIHNVSNTCPQVTYHGGARSVHRGRFATSAVGATVGASATDNHASSSYHNPQSQVSIWNNRTQLSYSSYVQPGDIRQMSAGEFAFMGNQMAQMAQEMPEIYNNNDTSNEEKSSLRSQSLSANFNRLTVEDRVPRSAHIHGSSSTADESHIIIAGDHTEVDDSFHQSNFNSNKVENNVVENSFGEGRQEDIRVRSTRRRSNEAHVSWRR